MVANGSVQAPSAAQVVLPSCRGLRLSAWELNCKSGMTQSHNFTKSDLLSPPIALFIFQFFYY